jgi:hypothetical protein
MCPLRDLTGTTDRRCAHWRLRWRPRRHTRRTPPRGRYVWCGKLSMCPNEMVPLQIDRAIDAGRYLEAATVNLADRDPAVQDAGDCNYRAPIRDCECAAGRSCGGVRLGIGVDGLTPLVVSPRLGVGRLRTDVPVVVAAAGLACSYRMPSRDQGPGEVVDNRSHQVGLLIGQRNLRRPRVRHWRVTTVNDQRDTLGPWP